MRILYEIYSKNLPDMGVTSKKLAKTMVDIAFQQGERVIFENKRIKLFGE